MGYWATIALRAFRETRDKARLDTVGNAVFVVMPMLFGGAVVAVATSSVPWSAVGALGGLTSAALTYFLCRVLALPEVLAREADERHRADANEIARQRDELQMLLGAIMPGQAEGERQRRASIVRQLVQLYMAGHDGISPQIIAGLELPPVKWLDHELSQRGYSWRVRDLGNGTFETY